jgi:uncharacterized membrane protein
MSTYQWVLFLHLLSAFLLASGALAYHLLHFALLKRQRPSEIAELFGAARVMQLGLQAGAMGTIIFGIWLAYIGEPDYGLGQGWIIAAIVLWVAANAFGAVGGKIYEGAQKLAAQLAAAGDAPSAELTALIRSPRAAVMTWASTLLVVTILVLMVWKPGGSI